VAAAGQGAVRWATLVWVLLLAVGKVERAVGVGFGVFEIEVEVLGWG
jgi:hypothetical protein